jgi:hypothetical protein
LIDRSKVRSFSGPAALNRPFVNLFEQQSAEQAGDGILVCFDVCSRFKTDAKEG